MNRTESNFLSPDEIVDAITRHIFTQYASGAGRIPVIAIYALYTLLVEESRRYDGTTLVPFAARATMDPRYKALGQVQVLDTHGDCFEVVEIKHNKPITAGMIDAAYRKIKGQKIDRYYILTTHEPNFDDLDTINARIDAIKKLHPCQIILNGVLPSLKYYLRLVSHPEDFVDIYTETLEDEFNRSSGIKHEHLEVWASIRQTVLQTK